MTSSIIVGLATGAASSLLVSIVFYKVGRRDAARSEKNTLLSLVSLRLREMTPTSRDRIPHGYGLRDTSHWLICISEILSEAGFQQAAEGVKSLADDMKTAPDYQQPPTREQKDEGEARKDEWKRRIQKLRK